MHTPNEEYKNFINAHMEAVVEYIQTKPRAKHMRDTSNLEKTR